MNNHDTMRTLLEAVAEDKPTALKVDGPSTGYSNSPNEQTIDHKTMNNVGDDLHKKKNHQFRSRNGDNPMAMTPVKVKTVENRLIREYAAFLKESEQLDEGVTDIVKKLAQKAINAMGPEGAKEMAAAVKQATGGDTTVNKANIQKVIKGLNLKQATQGVTESPDAVDGYVDSDRGRAVGVASSTGLDPNDQHNEKGSWKDILVKVGHTSLLGGAGAAFAGVFGISNSALIFVGMVAFIALMATGAVWTNEGLEEDGPDHSGEDDYWEGRGGMHESNYHDDAGTDIGPDDNDRSAWAPDEVAGWYDDDDLGEGEQLNEYLLSDGDPYADLQGWFNVFSDTIGESPVHEYEEEFADSPDWMNVVKHYTPIARKLQAALEQSDGKFNSYTKDLAEDLVYQGSASYETVEEALDYLPELYDQQIEFVENLLDGAYDDEGFDESAQQAEMDAWDEEHDTRNQPSPNRTRRSDSLGTFDQQDDGFDGSPNNTYDEGAEEDPWGLGEDSEEIVRYSLS